MHVNLSCISIIQSHNKLSVRGRQMLHGGSGGIMATNIPITPPEKFDFKEWLKWKHRFEHFLSTSGLDKEDEAGQASTLLNCLGKEAHDVLASTNMRIAKTIRKF